MTDANTEFLERFNKGMQDAKMAICIESMLSSGLAPQVMFILDHCDVSFQPKPPATVATTKAFFTANNLLSHLRISEEDVEVKLMVLSLAMDSIGRYDQLPGGFSVTVRFNQVLTTVYVPFEAIVMIESLSGEIKVVNEMSSDTFQRLKKKVARGAVPQGEQVEDEGDSMDEFFKQVSHDLTRDLSGPSAFEVDSLAAKPRPNHLRVVK